MERHLKSAIEFSRSIFQEQCPKSNDLRNNVARTISDINKYPKQSTVTRENKIGPNNRQFMIIHPIAITDTQDVVKTNNMMDRLRFAFLAPGWHPGGNDYRAKILRAELQQARI
jgi:hypothetical protein